MSAIQIWRGLLTLLTLCVFPVSTVMGQTTDKPREPVDYIILIDVSRSITAEEFDGLQAPLRMVIEKETREGDLLYLVAFCAYSQVYLDSVVRDDVEALELFQDCIRRIRDEWIARPDKARRRLTGSTSLTVALDDALLAYYNRQKRKQPNQKVVILVLSDGRQDTGFPDLDQKLPEYLQEHIPDSAWFRTYGFGIQESTKQSDDLPRRAIYLWESVDDISMGAFQQKLSTFLAWKPDDRNRVEQVVDWIIVNRWVILVVFLATVVGCVLTYMAIRLARKRNPPVSDDYGPTSSVSQGPALPVWVYAPVERHQYTTFEDNAGKGHFMLMSVPIMVELRNHDQAKTVESIQMSSTVWDLKTVPLLAKLVDKKPSKGGTSKYEFDLASVINELQREFFINALKGEEAFDEEDTEVDTIREEWEKWQELRPACGFLPEGSPVFPIETVISHPKGIRLDLWGLQDFNIDVPPGGADEAHGKVHVQWELRPVWQGKKATVKCNPV